MTDPTKQHRRAAGHCSGATSMELAARSFCPCGHFLISGCPSYRFHYFGSEIHPQEQHRLAEMLNNYLADITEGKSHAVELFAIRL